MQIWESPFMFSRGTDLIIQLNSSNILARSTLDMGRGGGGRGVTLPSSNYIKAKVKWLWMVVKIPISLAFSKLVLDVKVKFLLISWHLSNQYFLQRKKKSAYIPKILPFWLHHRLSSTNVIISLFALSVISSLSNPKQKLISLGSHMAPSTKIRKFKSLRVYQPTI